MNPRSVRSEQDSLASLARVFAELRRLSVNENTDDESKSLREFLFQLRELSRSLAETKIVSDTVVPDVTRLMKFIDSFRPEYKQLRNVGEFIDFWTVAGLGRDEIRHASALAWFLNPMEAHGFDATIFSEWVRNLRFGDQTGFGDKAIWNADYRVRKEVTFPDGRNRVDIEIESDQFYLCIEVKVDAPSDVDQLVRYFQAAKAKAGLRPFSVVFLARDISKELLREISAKLSFDFQWVVSTTWSNFAKVIRQERRRRTPKFESFSERLLEQFLSRVDNL
jgi:hypothetical protein